jgi:FemAB-related protein (PEP-CTERM system-associated)
MTATALASRDALTAVVHHGAAAMEQQGRFAELRKECGATSPSVRGEWLAILQQGLGHSPYCIEARQSDKPVGILPLCYLHTRLFGKFLVGMPYLNVGGVVAQDAPIAAKLIDEAVRLADELDVRYLELRHELRWPHPALNYESSQKVHMRLELPESEVQLWASFKPKVRNQIRKAEQNQMTVAWGGRELLNEFYSVFAVNMRDLGTPVFGRRLFAAILQRLGADAEICVVRQGGAARAAGLLIYGERLVEVPSASSLRQFNHLNANMLLYWNLLRRSIHRRMNVFDFGRTTIGSNTHRFKSQWGAEPHAAVWQYYVRQGSVGEMRPDNPKLQRRIAMWRRLPVWLTRLAGPHIVRGIP